MTNSAQSWTRTTSADSGNSSAKPNRTISSADGLTYSNMGSGNNIQYIGWANSTGSSYTGMAAGIATNTTNLTVGNGTMSQSGNNYYWYAEVSGSSRYSCRYMKSPSHTFSVGDKIRLADTELFIEIEKDYTSYGEEVKFGGGKVIRDGMGQSQISNKKGAMDTVITNAVILDYWGIVKADIGIKDGYIFSTDWQF